MGIGTVKTDFNALLWDILTYLMNEFGEYDNPELADRVRKAIHELEEL